MSGTFVEDPTMRIVDVHWKKGDGEPPDPTLQLDPCGMFYYPSMVPFMDCPVWFIYIYQPYMLGLAHTLSASSENNNWNNIIPVGPFSGGEYAGYDKYYWGNDKASVQIIADGTGWPPDPVRPAPPPIIGMDTYYNTQLEDFVIGTTPDETIIGGPGYLDHTFPGIGGYPIMAFWIETAAGSRVHPRFLEPGWITLRIQIRCTKTFAGVVPPQPNFGPEGNPPGGLWSQGKYFPSPPDPPPIKRPPSTPTRGTSGRTFNQSPLVPHRIR